MKNDSIDSFHSISFCLHSLIPLAKKWIHLNQLITINVYFIFRSPLTLYQNSNIAEHLIRLYELNMRDVSHIARIYIHFENEIMRFFSHFEFWILLSATEQIVREMPKEFEMKIGYTICFVSYHLKMAYSSMDYLIDKIR